MPDFQAKLRYELPLRLTGRHAKTRQLAPAGETALKPRVGRNLSPFPTESEHSQRKVRRTLRSQLRRERISPDRKDPLRLSSCRVRNRQTPAPPVQALHRRTRQARTCCGPQDGTPLGTLCNLPHRNERTKQVPCPLSEHHAPPQCRLCHATRKPACGPRAFHALQWKSENGSQEFQTLSGSGSREVTPRLPSSIPRAGTPRGRQHCPGVFRDKILSRSEKRSEKRTGHLQLPICSSLQDAALAAAERIRGP